MARNLVFEGADELARILDALPGRLGKKRVGEILRKAAKPIVAEARSRVPVLDKDTQKSIGVIAGRGRGRGEQVYIGPRRGGPFKGYAGHLIEYGTAPRKLKDGTSTGSMPAHPFMRPAYEVAKGAALQIIKDEVAADIADGFRNASRLR